MPLEKLRIFGNPNIGVYIFTNNKVTLVPEGTQPQVKKALSDTLSTEVLEAVIADSRLLGIFIAGNDKAILLPKTARDKEVDRLKELGLPVKVVFTSFTALGNIILTNNRVALIHPELSDKEVEVVCRELNVEKCVRRSIVNIPTVGSVAVINDNSGLFHPDVNESELKALEELLKIRVGTGTVNFGVGFIKTGLIANNFGAVVGDLTTGPEIMRVMDAFNLR